VTLLVVAYLAVYRAVGGGTAGSDAYLSPFSDTARFAAVAPLRLLMFMGEVLAGVPVEFSLGGPMAPFVVTGALATLGAALLWRTVSRQIPAEEAVALRWLVPGATLGVLASCSGLPGGRALLLADVGFAVFLAVLLRRGWEAGASRRGVKLATALLAVIHLVLAPLEHVTGTLVTMKMGRDAVAIARALPSEVHPARRVFILAASDPMTSMYPILTLLADGRRDLDCLVRLDNTRGDFAATRTGERQLSLESLGPPMLRSTFETLYRTRGLPFHAGDEVAVCGGHVRVAEVVDGSPTRLVVDLGAPLDDPGVAMVAWDGERLARVRLAEGERRLLPWRPGPMQTQ
jgi:hypothetical protein